MDLPHSHATAMRAYRRARSRCVYTRQQESVTYDEKTNVRGAPPVSSYLIMGLERGLPMWANGGRGTYERTVRERCKVIDEEDE